MSTVDFAVEKIRQDFPILATQMRGKPLVYLDNAATTQKPQAVIAAIDDFYQRYNANIHRGVYYISELATQAYEAARQKVKQFINAGSDDEIVFVRGTTEAINLVAQSFLRPNLQPGDEIVITMMEHHANIVPWQLLCEQTGAKLKVAPINQAGELLLDEFAGLLNARTKLVALTHISNALGTINPVKEIIELAHVQQIPVLLDGAQAVIHMPIDVQTLDCDFYAFSGHKMCGPTGIGVLYGKAEILEKMPPYQGGGDMIQQVSFTRKTTFKPAPFKFEAGTPNIAGVIGLSAAIDYLNTVSLAKITAYEHELSNYLHERLAAIAGLRMVGTAQRKTGVLSFILDTFHAHDLATILDGEGIAIRAGHHCSMPLMQHLGVAATARASIAFYNTKHEIDRLVAGLYKVKEILQ